MLLSEGSHVTSGIPEGVGNFVVVYLYSYCYICLQFEQDWGVAAITQRAKQPQLLGAPSEIFL